MKLSRAWAAAILVVGVCVHQLAPIASADDSEQLLTVDHYVRIRSTVPAIAGQPAQIYVRERAKAVLLAGALLIAVVARIFQQRARGQNRSAAVCGPRFQHRLEPETEFMMTCAPIPVAGGTGSPVNPLAIF